MKSVKTLLFIISFLVSATSFAQSPKAIEADLLRSFDKIDYWDQKRSDINAYDSLEKANEVFAKKLKLYTAKYPATLHQSFSLLIKAGLKIVTSPDSVFRIYCWDTSLGGTMRMYQNLAQYKSGANTSSMYIVTDKGGYEPFYSNLYTIKTSTQTYYLGINTGILSSAYITQQAKIFAIEQGKLNINAKLIKTNTGLHNSLNVDSDLSSGVNKDVDKQPELTFDPQTQTIQIPLIAANGKVTGKFITYKFTGQYFEKVKK
jgi:hypothetical protein